MNDIGNFAHNRSWSERLFSAEMALLRSQSYIFQRDYRCAFYECVQNRSLRSVACHWIFAVFGALLMMFCVTKPFEIIEQYILSHIHVVWRLLECATIFASVSFRNQSRWMISFALCLSLSLIRSSILWPIHSLLQIVFIGVVICHCFKRSRFAFYRSIRLLQFWNFHWTIEKENRYQNVSHKSEIVKSQKIEKIANITHFESIDDDDNENDSRTIDELIVDEIDQQPVLLPFWRNRQYLAR